MAKTWVVVVDSSCARLLEASTPTGPLVEVEMLDHPEGRMRAQELTTDLPGRAFDSSGRGRHAMEREVGPRQQEAITFARRVAQRLQGAAARGEIERIVLVAPPAFLGLLRDALGAEVRRIVTAELDLNLAKLTPAEIRGRLPERLYHTLEPR